MEDLLRNSRYSNNREVREDNFFSYDYTSGLLIVEKNTLLAMEILNIKTFERTRDVFQLIYNIDEDCEIVILVTKEEYQFRISTTEWTKGSYEPVRTSKFFKRFSIDKMSEDKIKSKLQELFRESLAKIENDLVTCRYCNEKFQPEHTIDGDVCHGCAVIHLNVIF